QSSPPDYDDNFLICDWSQGRILAIELKRAGGTYQAREKLLVGGQPLNCTDIEVGPDGAVYFTTGGRGTLGGLYRVAWKDARPSMVRQGSIDEAIDISSPLSSFAQERLRQIRERVGAGDWVAGLMKVARDTSSTPRRRVHALDLLAQFGAPRSEYEDLPAGLAREDKDPSVRAQAVLLLGALATDKARSTLVETL